MRLDPNNTSITLQYANLLWHMKRTEEARKLYAEVLKSDPKNRYALEAMGYIAREENDNAAAERYFNQLASDYPDDYVPYLALGDLYTATMQFDRANASYEQAFKRAPRNADRDRQRGQRRHPGRTHSARRRLGRPRHRQHARRPARDART